MTENGEHEIAATPAAPPAAPVKTAWWRRAGARSTAPERRADRTRRERESRWSRRSRRPILVAANAAFTFAVLVFLAVLVGIQYFHHEIGTPGSLAQAKVVVVPRGAGSREVADQLKQDGVIDNSWMFFASVQAAGDRGKLKAGEYLIPPHATIRQILAMLAAGKVMQHQITVPEGLTSQQVVDRLKGEDFLAGAIDAAPKEGTLLPETYDVPRGTPRTQVLDNMEEKDRAAVAQIWAGREPGLPLKSPEELVTLASVVEKETGLAAERPRVAAVFINRLKKGMRLQSDPTIIYGLVGGKGTLGRPIKKSEIEAPTPYNTYTIRGLPPGPITNPGRASLEAAAHPAATDDLYFVADGNGGHAFAATWAEHRKNVAHLREVEDMRGIAEPDKAVLDIDDDPAAEAAPAPAPARPARRR